ncbi:murein biosynthesis integral membrane protein MurJ [Clostridium algoriphilum]|uniref:murein biosynthesis integral membrane protein MurJ n=1 Tax=Clostridium algoriphilum TaxID=198347 RepID=UPI001CF325CF|nr:murein biosynthesis integral membrane protein MurJ [Clostridium algoriphilum]MCB2295189.1 murein biosynthesis integral membrane protein MurJ [Clostridium algoriphilum]
MKKNFNYSKLVVIIVVINIILAVLALLKDMFMASYFGTTVNADAFTLSFFITDMLGNNLIANAIAVSCVPLFTKIYADNDEYKLYDNLIKVNISYFILTLISFLMLLIFRDQIISKLASGFTNETINISIQLLIILLPIILIYPIVTSGISYLQVKGKFIISSLAAILYNFIFLLGIVYCAFFKIPVSKGLFIVAYSVVAAVLAMVILLYWKIIKEKKPSRRKDKKHLMKRGEIYKLFIPYCAILLLSQFVLYYERYLASFFQGGSVAALNYAYRLSQFPIWVFVSAIATVLFPRMAKHNSEGDLKSLAEVFKNALLWVFILTMPVTFILYILRNPIISILFLRGAFDSSSLKITSEILAGYSLAIIGLSISALCMKLYLAREEIKTPLLIFIISSIINIIIDFFLVSRIGIKGVGYGAAISSIINATLMLLLIKIEIKDSFHKITIKLLKCVVSNLILIVICVFGLQIWNLNIIRMNLISQLAYIGAVALLSISAYVISLRCLKVI